MAIEKMKKTAIIVKASRFITEKGDEALVLSKLFSLHFFRLKAIYEAEAKYVEQRMIARQSSGNIREKLYRTQLTGILR